MSNPAPIESLRAAVIGLVGLESDPQTLKTIIGLLVTTNKPVAVPRPARVEAPARRSPKRKTKRSGGSARTMLSDEIRAALTEATAQGVTVHGLCRQTGLSAPQVIRALGHGDATGLVTGRLEAWYEMTPKVDPGQPRDDYGVSEQSAIDGLR